jgi:murein DD-endopeptidase MepM/ murein hydrolase activator NlpD
MMILFRSIRPSIAFEKIDINLKLKKFRGNLLKQEKKLKRLNYKFEGLEKKLGKKNKNFSKLEKEKNELEESIFVLKGDLDRNEDLLKDKIFKSRRVFYNFVIHNFGKEENFDFLIKKKYYSNKLKLSMKEIKLNLNFNLRLKKEIKKLIIKFDEYESVQKNLITLLVSIEKERKKIKGEYNYLLKNKNRMEIKYKRLGSKIKIPFYLGKLKFPLRNYIKMKYKSRGITFYYKNRIPIFSSEKGKVVYSGKLSTYGEVIIIDHGHQTKTVFLGGFLKLPKKGKKVRKGQIIGYLNPEIKERKLYFEVRKMGKVQNTISFLNKKIISKKMTTI